MLHARCLQGQRSLGHCVSRVPSQLPPSGLRLDPITPPSSPLPIRFPSCKFLALNSSPEALRGQVVQGCHPETGNHCPPALLGQKFMPHRLLGLVRMLRLDSGTLCHVLRSWYWPESHPTLSGAAHACISLHAERNRVKGTRGLFRQQTQGILGRPHSSPSALAHLTLDAICSFRRFTHRSLHTRLHP